jgi:hypothetical protein
MKQKLTIFFSLILLVNVTFAQKAKGLLSGRHLLGMHINTIDVRSPREWKDANGARTITGLKNQDFGFSVSAWSLFSSRVDLSAKATLLFHNYAASDRGTYDIANNQFGFELEPSINVKAFEDASFFNAFFSMGIGAGVYSGKVGTYFPVGFGLQVNMKSDTYFLLQSQMRYSLTEDVHKDNLFYSFGIAQKF